MVKKHIEAYENLSVLTRKCHSDHRKHINYRYELVDEPKKQPNRMFFHKDLALKNNTVNSYKFKRKLGFDLVDVTNTKEQTILGAKWMQLDSNP